MIIILIVYTYNTPLLRQHYPHSLYGRHTTVTYLYTLAVCSVHLVDIGICRGKPKRCNSPHRYHLGSPHTRHIGSLTECKGHCRTETDRHDKRQNLRKITKLRILKIYYKLEKSMSLKNVIVVNSLQFSSSLLSPQLFWWSHFSFGSMHFCPFTHRNLSSGQDTLIAGPQFSSSLWLRQS